MRTRFGPGSLAAGAAMYFVLWQLLAWTVHRPILPSPVEVLPIFARLLPGELGRHFLASAARVLAAILLAVATAAPLGLGLGQSRRIDRVVAPLVAIVHPIPKIVLLPVIYVLLGISDASKVLLVASILFFQILVVVRDEAARLRPELLLSVRSLGAGRRALLRFVYVPATLPATLTALRVSVGSAIAVLFIAEQSLTRWGLGYYIVVETYQVLRYREMYAGILAMSLLGLVLTAALELLERRANRHLYLGQRP